MTHNAFANHVSAAKAGDMIATLGSLAIIICLTIPRDYDSSWTYSDATAVTIRGAARISLFNDQDIDFMRGER